MNSSLLFPIEFRMILILYSIIYVISCQKQSDHILKDLKLLNNEKKNYGDYCEDINRYIDLSTYYKKCHEKFQCYKNHCKCPIGSAYHEQTKECVKFEQFSCVKDSDCQDMDNNRYCNTESNKCECRQEFFEESNNRLCTRRQSQLNQTCLSDTDCNFNYTHCKSGFCQCWPEFEAQETTRQNRKIHSCIRKICSNDSNCQTSDNPNLVCNNTICECEYGYSLDNQRICVKMTRRQNCNITCQIIGGLFASIFMLSLIYWCFYCCYSIVKNYKFHFYSRDRVDNNNAPTNENIPPTQRFTQSCSSPGIVIRRDHYSDHSPGRRTEYRHSYYYESENPPSYSQLLDPPPDYETVLNMKINE